MNSRKGRRQKCLRLFLFRNIFRLYSEKLTWIKKGVRNERENREFERAETENRD